jgi:hypothetical protein
MKIAVVGDMNPTRQTVIDKMIADGHEIVYIGKGDPYGGVDMDFCIVDEYSNDLDSMFKNPELATILSVQSYEWKPKTRPQKPYYRQKEKY